MGLAQSTNHVTEDVWFISDSFIQCCDLDIIEMLIKPKHKILHALSAFQTNHNTNFWKQRHEKFTSNSFRVVKENVKSFLKR